MDSTKKCPYCGEEIKAIAKKCRHCGEWLDHTESSSEIKNIIKPNVNTKKNNKNMAKYAIAAIVIMFIAFFAYVLFPKSGDAPIPYYNEEEPVTEEVSPSLWGMSCKDASYHNVEWRIKYLIDNSAVTMTLEVSTKGDNNFYPTNCFLDTNGNFYGITKDCASYLYSRFRTAEKSDGSYSEIFPLTPNNFDNSAKIGYEGY